MTFEVNSGADVRQPRLRVLIDGRDVPGVFEADVVSNNHLSADLFHVSIALAADPRIVNDIGNREEIRVELQLSLDGGGEYVSLIQGEADSIAIDPLRGLIRLDGRDLSGRLIETRTREVFVNQTASDIATTLASRHGLEADVVETSRIVGRNWASGRDRLGLAAYGRATTEWDLLVGLAVEEGFGVWVSGETLHFRPGADERDAVTLGPSDVSSLRLERSLTLAGDIEVVVRTWNVLRQQAFVQTARRSGGGRRSGERARRYVYVIPGLTPDEALRVAQARLAQITRHERVVAIEMPGDLTIEPRGRLQLSATGTDFDQDYWVDRVERRISVAHGFRQTVRARNTSAALAGGSGEVGPWTDF